ncbi:hypothetical protein COCMIDRAFT_86141 [Bipolaris oryzae ATCC 44560]|uniref:EH domain-containing protein n=1 Tax=Bipolaris oryzae ATCC 44560 TaxID=930090 RepID=W6ZAP2_COCMI|nr:uncharacterized protein COCMIDRAFT_86141 [Bipolaris oryzae ATCC 44560]EUC48817.1 hypothetical protein COCMIDRAFT_86141 [Bipolaris oryzae ATCC 44560]
MSSTRNQGWVPQSAGDVQHNVRNAALQGASKAFSKPLVKPKPATNTYTGGDNAAWLAATRVGTGSPASLQRDHTGGSLGVSRPITSNPANPTSLSVPGDHLDRVPSPSNIAARLAAARHSPLKPMPQPKLQPAPSMDEQEPNERDILPPPGSVGNLLAKLEPKKPGPQSQKRRDSLESRSTASRVQRPESASRPTDDTPIPPTNTLVKMFEQGRSTTPTDQTSTPLHVTRSSPPPVRSPKPRRNFSLPPDPEDDAPLQRKRTQTPPPVKPKPKHQIQLPPQFTDGASEAYFNTPKKGPVKSPLVKQKPVELAAITTTISPPRKGSGQTRPKSQDASTWVPGQRRRMSTSMESSRPPSTPSSFKSAKEEQEEEDDVEVKLKPTVPPPRRSTTRKAESVPASQKLQPTTPIQIKPRAGNRTPGSTSPVRNLSPRRPASNAGTASPSVYHNNYQRESVKQITQHMTGESLSSAIMGAALASHSRNVSPAPRPMSVEPLFPPRKQHHHHHLPFHRSPSPQKNSPPKSTGKLRTTMRKEPSSSDDEDNKVDKYKKKGTRIMGIKGRKHPNKHDEGNRKRWRDQITERERKRYEGVWAANKGLFIPSSPRAPPDDDPSADVLNLVAKEIWTRSRLPTHVLEEVWDLVDGRAIGRLTRYEFIVGLWLIDQRLKGRKLPVKVSDSVWRSARNVDIKVKIKH